MLRNSLVYVLTRWDNFIKLIKSNSQRDKELWKQCTRRKEIKAMYTKIPSAFHTGLGSWFILSGLKPRKASQENYASAFEFLQQTPQHRARTPWLTTAGGSRVHRMTGGGGRVWRLCANQDDDMAGAWVGVYTGGGMFQRKLKCTQTD